MRHRPRAKTDNFLIGGQGTHWMRGSGFPTRAIFEAREINLVSTNASKADISSEVTRELAERIPPDEIELHPLLPRIPREIPPIYLIATHSSKSDSKTGEIPFVD